MTFPDMAGELIRILMNENILKKVGKNLARIIDERGMKNYEFAYKIKISPQHMSAIVNGKSNLSLKKLGMICDVLGIDPIVLFEKEKKPEEELARSISKIILKLIEPSKDIKIKKRKKVKQ
ncbi:MAG: helix-turn-helix domain-containing protein [Bacillota bacterium]